MLRNGRYSKKVNTQFPGIIVITIFCVILLTTNITAQYLISFWNFTVTIALFIYPLTFLVTDYVSEIYGKKACIKLVILGLLFSLFPSFIFSTPQIIAGSLLAYLIAQFHDVWAFHWWKRLTKNRHLWIRNNMSTVVSQLFDTVIFTFVAFYGVYDINIILSIMISEYPIKVAMAVIDTGPLYILVGFSRIRIVKSQL